MPWWMIVLHGVSVACLVVAIVCGGMAAFHLWRAGRLQREIDAMQKAGPHGDWRPHV